MGGTLDLMLREGDEMGWAVSSRARVAIRELLSSRGVAHRDERMEKHGRVTTPAGYGRTGPHGSRRRYRCGPSPESSRGIGWSLELASRPNSERTTIGRQCRDYRDNQRRAKTGGFIGGGQKKKRQRRLNVASGRHGDERRVLCHMGYRGGHCARPRIILRRLSPPRYKSPSWLP